MMPCVILSLSECTLIPKAEVTDSFCLLYEPIIQQKGDSAITAKPEVKKRILGNERLARHCP